MAAKVQGTKVEVKKANRIANVIITGVILSFIAITMLVLSSAGAFAQNTKGAEVDGNLINMMDEIEKPFDTVLDNLKIDPDVNTVEHGVNRYGNMYIKATYYDSGNIVTHIFSKKNECVSVDFRSTNFRNYQLMLKAIGDTFDPKTFNKIKNGKQQYIIDIKAQRSLWFVKITRR